jgi:hypothetical protein
MDVLSAGRFTRFVYEDEEEDLEDLEDLDTDELDALDELEEVQQGWEAFNDSEPGKEFDTVTTAIENHQAYNFMLLRNSLLLCCIDAPTAELKRLPLYQLAQAYGWFNVYQGALAHEKPLPPKPEYLKEFRTIG